MDLAYISNTLFILTFSQLWSKKVRFATIAPSSFKEAPKFSDLRRMSSYLKDGRIGSRHHGHIFLSTAAQGSVWVKILL